MDDQKKILDSDAANVKNDLVNKCHDNLEKSMPVFLSLLKHLPSSISCWSRTMYKLRNLRNLCNMYFCVLVNLHKHDLSIILFYIHSLVLFLMHTVSTVLNATFFVHQPALGYLTNNHHQLKFEDDCLR